MYNSNHVFLEEGGEWNDAKRREESTEVMCDEGIGVLFVSIPKNKKKTEN